MILNINFYSKKQKSKKNPQRLIFISVIQNNITWSFINCHVLWNTLVTALYRVNYLPFSQRKQFWTISIDPNFNWNQNFTKLCIKRKITESVMFNDPPGKNGKAKFTTVSLKALSVQIWMRYPCFWFSITVYFQLRFLLKNDSQEAMEKFSYSNNFRIWKTTLFLIFLIRLRFTLVNRSLRSLQLESIEFMV